MNKLFKAVKVCHAMAAAFIHYFLGLGLAYVFGYRGTDALLFGLVGALQDLDFLTMFFYNSLMKSRIARLFTHRGITHTILFTLVCSGIVLWVSPVLSLFVFLNFVLHIFTDYVTAWGVAPFAPFSSRRYSLGLMTIFDVPLTLLSAVCGVSGFISVNPYYAFAAFFGYIFLRFSLKRRLKYKDLTPLGQLTYVFCLPEDDYTVGKIDIFGREKSISVPRTTPEIDPSVLDKVKSAVGRSMLSHFLEYPTYVVEDGTIVIKDARSYLFPSSRLFGFVVYFDRETEGLYVKAAGRRIEMKSG